MKYLLATAAVLALATSAQAQTTESTGVPSHPFGAGECTSTVIGGKTWSFRTVDVGNNALGRFTAVMNASLGQYPITVRVASKSGRPDVPDTVECINGEGQGTSFPTPFAFR